jgi:hypothetical protein
LAWRDRDWAVLPSSREKRKGSGMRRYLLEEQDPALARSVAAYAAQVRVAGDVPDDDDEEEDDEEEPREPHGHDDEPDEGEPD